MLLSKECVVNWYDGHTGGFERPKNQPSQPKLVSYYGTINKNLFLESECF